MTVWKNDGSPFSGTWPSTGVSSNAPYGGAYADLDNDGDLDLAAGDSSNSLIVYNNTLIHRNYHNWPTPGADISTSANSPYSIFAADMDGDGDIDILSASNGDDTITWYENDGNSNPSWDAEVIATSADGATSVFAADMDNDGDMDIVSGSENDDTIAWYENDGEDDPSWDAENIYTDARGPWCIFVADMDNDGDMDIVSAEHGDDTIALYTNDGEDDPSWSQSEVDTNADIATSVFAADMDNDGDMDIISSSAGDDTIAWYRNNLGTGVGSGWTAENIDTDADYAWRVFAADMDNDGDMDILSASTNDDKIAWYENDGDSDDPSWDAEVIATSADGARGVFAADMDNDGDMDIISASTNDDTIAWYENNGDSDNPSWDAQDIATTSTDYPVSVFAADLDNDGDMDIISSAIGDDKIAWYENIGGSVAYDVESTAPSSLGNSDKEDLLKIEVNHDGRPGDNDLELVTWKLLLEETDGDVLTTTEANNIIANLYVYNDDGTASGSYDVGDTVEITISTLSLSSGIQTITFTDNAGDTAISATNSKTFFIVVEMTSDATSQGIDSLRVSFDPDAYTVNEDRTEDTSISVEDSTEITTGDIEIPEFPTILAPILSVLLIVGFNYRRRRPNLAE